MRQVINVAFASDDKFAQHLCVTLVSLLENLSPGREVAVYILDCGINADKRAKIQKSVERFKDRLASLDFIRVDPSQFADFEVTPNISHATYFRIILPRILSQVDRVINLDSDMVLEGDIGQLFDTPLDEKWLAAVRDPSAAQDKEYGEMLGIPSRHGFFNAGMMLMDLAALRKHEIPEQVLSALRNINRFASALDQPGLNYILHDSWKELPPTWNFQPSTVLNPGHCEDIYTAAAYADARSNPKIIHYVSRFTKPWRFAALPLYRERYFHYLKLTEFRDFRPRIGLNDLFLWIAYRLYFMRLPPSVRSAITGWLDRRRYARSSQNK